MLLLNSLEKLWRLALIGGLSDLSQHDKHKQTWFPSHHDTQQEPTLRPYDEYSPPTPYGGARMRQV
jgi:hypothetical protein